MHGDGTRRRAVLLLLLMVAATACSDGEGRASPTTTSTSADTQRPVSKGGSLVLGVDADVSTLAPGDADGSAEQLIALGIYDPLLTYADGRITPNLADRIEVADDLTEYTITLRDGVRFHDGTSLDADAVVRHFERLMEPASGCSCAAAVGQIRSMDAPDGADGLTVSFDLRAPSVTFPDLLAGSVGLIESPTAVAGGLDLTVGGVGTGPFTLAESTAPGRFVLEANPSYWKTDADGIQLPYLESLVVLTMPDRSGHLDAVAGGAIDLLQTSDPETMKQAPAHGLAVQPLASPWTTLLVLNSSARPFDDPRARRAVALALDRDLLNASAYMSMGVPSYSLISPDSAFYEPELGAPEPDPARARELVQEVGGLQFTIICVSTAQTDLLMPAVVEVAGASGMEIDLDMIDAEEFAQRVRSQSGDFDAACHRGKVASDPDALRPGFTSGDGANLALYANDEVDHLLDEASRVGAFGERHERYLRVQQILASETPLLPTIFDVAGIVYNDLRVDRLPDGEPNTAGFLVPALLVAAG